MHVVHLLSGLLHEGKPGLGAGAAAGAVENAIETAVAPVHYEPEDITVTPCSDGTHDCDTASTFCAATTDHDSGFFCLCLEGFERLGNAFGQTECTTAGEASEAPTGEGEDTTVLVIVPTNPCIDGSHGCDTTSTHCVETHWHNSGYLCLCLPGFYRTKNSDGGWRAKAAKGTEDHSTCWPKAIDAGTVAPTVPDAAAGAESQKEISDSPTAESSSRTAHTVLMLVAVVSGAVCSMWLGLLLVGRRAHARTEATPLPLHAQQTTDGCVLSELM
jgi:hypothetical protein